MRRSSRQLLIVTAAVVALTACGDRTQPTIDDLPLSEGLEVVAPASACPRDTSDCILRVVVGGPPGEPADELVRRQRRAAEREGWRVTSTRGGVTTATREEMSLEIHLSADWARDASDPGRAVIGVVLERQVRG